MRVQVTKTMTRALNQECSNREFTNIDKFEYDSLLPYQYQFCVDDDLFRALDNGDYDSSTDTFKFIRVIYKPECYSVDRYITSYDLYKAFLSSDKSYDGFMDNVFNEYEI